MQVPAAKGGTCRYTQKDLQYDLQTKLLCTGPASGAAPSAQATPDEAKGQSRVQGGCAPDVLQADEASSLKAEEASGPLVVKAESPL